MEGLVDPDITTFTINTLWQETLELLKGFSIGLGCQR